MFVVRRLPENPLLRPNFDRAWDGFGAFNWCPVDKEGKTHVVYRAMSLADPLREGPHNISTVGYAVSEDGVHFSGNRQLIAPEHDWEKYGCEDPRVTYFEGTYCIFYTALSQFPFRPEGIRTALATTRDFKKIDSKHLITPFNSKAMALFPERVNGKITAILTADSERMPKKVAIAQFDTDSDLIDQEWWKKWYENIDAHRIYPERTNNDQVEVGSPPLKTDRGWLVIYSLIENHFDKGIQYQYVYGIEAVLLDMHDPHKIIGATKGPMLTPFEGYERAGIVGNVIFPSGARIHGDQLEIYYGAADTTGCVASVRLTDLLDTMHPETASRMSLTRSSEEPIITPRPENAWENKATFNPAAIDIDGTVHILYRAMGNDDTSVIGYATSEDAVHITERLSDPVYVPRSDFEQKRRGGNSGCEDPRITRIGDTLHMMYTAYDGIGPPRVATSSISISNFTKRKWEWSEPQLVTPAGVDDKDACLFPRTIEEKYVLAHRIANTICLFRFDTLDFAHQKANTCTHVLGPRPGMWDNLKVGLAGPPLETPGGWLLFYHGVSGFQKTYRMGVALLDLKDPSIVLGRSTDAIFSPEAKYEKEGIVPNVVFPCGHILRNGIVYSYYGGADTVINVAEMKLDTILTALRP
ncbi:MAG: hypothetical protein AAB421_01440 [Patescibacteria group bacterium]